MKSTNDVWLQTKTNPAFLLGMVPWYWMTPEKEVIKTQAKNCTSNRDHLLLVAPTEIKWTPTKRIANIKHPKTKITSLLEKEKR